MRMLTRAAVALSEWLRTNGKNQADLADLVSQRLGRQVHQSTIHRALNGTVPHGSLLAAFSALCAVPVEWWAEPAPEGSSSETEGAA